MNMTHRISGLDNVSGRYAVVSDTPDGGRSTYAECWGASATFSARAVFASDDLAAAITAAERHGWRSFDEQRRVVWTSAAIVDRRTGRQVGVRRLAAAAHL